MDLTADGWVWNERASAYVRIIDAGDALEIQCSVPVTGSMRYDPAQSDTDPAEQVEAIIDVLTHQIDSAIVPPDITWLHTKDMTPEALGHGITNLIRGGRSFVVITEKDEPRVRHQNPDTRPDSPKG